ncbi:MAG: MazG family protein [Actinomycetota bacterium]|nr:MazG family protein [Actinomycetota bacterium]
MSPGRLTLLLTTPRVPAGLLSRDAWLALDEAALVVGRDAEPQVEALRTVGVPVQLLATDGQAAAARDLVDRATALGAVVWVGSSDGDPGLTDAIASEVSRLPDPPEVEVVIGSYDVPGSRLLDVVAVMDRLRSPGGCPWDAEQTHATLVPYLVEEAHEAVEAIESGDREHMREELGDVLLQVAFHARVAQDDEGQPFDIDDVAAGLVAKLVRRHPHVFAADGVGGDAVDSESVEASWETIKAAEKAQKAGAAGAEVGGAGPLDGIPVALPPLARATKVVSRLRRRGRDDLLEACLETAYDDPRSRAGQRLLALVAELGSSGIDPDQALRGVLRDLTLHAASQP